MDKARYILKEKGIRTTRYRAAVLRLLTEDEDRFLTIDEIRRRVAEEYPTFDFSTAYRTLELLEQAGVAYKTRIGDKVCYSMKCPVEREHHHLVCRNCGRKVLLDFCPFRELEEKVESLGFGEFEHMRDFFGLCDACRGLDDDNE